MLLLLIIITESDFIYNLIEKNGINLIDDDALHKMGVNRSNSIIKMMKKESIDNDNLLNTIYNDILNDINPECVLIHADDKFIKIKELSNFFNICCYDYTNNNSINFVKKNILDHMKKTLNLKTLLGNGKYIKTYTLPLRNFKSIAFNDLKDSLKKVEDVNFLNNFRKKIDTLNKKKTPRSPEERKKKFFIDDDGKLFKNGDEHGEADSGPPHLISCCLGKKWRFGIRFDPSYHYDVMYRKEKSVKGEYFYCHGKEYFSKQETHINIFPNDFFK